MQVIDELQVDAL